MKDISFKDLGLSPEILKAVEKKGFEKPSPIQAGVIPLLLNGENDIIGQAQTGTGKTAAFALPLLERLDNKANQTQAIILAPTRELAIQVEKEIKSFSVKSSPTVTVLYGGNPMGKEISALKKNPTIVVGTPGRVQHHIRNKKLKLDNIKYFVLDEADEMLNFGFREEIEDILDMTPENRKVLLFSATMPRSIMKIVDKYMKKYDTVKVKSEEMTNENIAQKYFCIEKKYKFEALCQIMEDAETFYAIVFCRTKADVDYVASKLAAKHLRAEAIHGDIDQSQREKVLRRFKEGSTNILVATDVAARGIDVSELNFVVNYTIPENEEIYTHRVGRTGRAGNKGTAITFVSGSELGRLKSFERKLNTHIKKGELPAPKDLIKKKQEHLIARIEHIINNEDTKNLSSLAKLLLEEGSPEQVVEALLRDSYKGEFDLRNYTLIPDDSAFANRGGGGGNGGRNRSFGGRRRRRRGRGGRSRR